MSLTAEAIEALAKMADGTVNEIGGRPFHMNFEGVTAVQFPMPATVQLFSLTQVLSYLGPLTKGLTIAPPPLRAPGDITYPPDTKPGAINVRSEDDPTPTFFDPATLDGRIVVNVTNYNEVELFNEKADMNNSLRIVAKASFKNMFEQFEQGRFEDQERFIIQLLSRFEETPERQELLKVVSKVKSGTSTTSSDDGFSQEVEVKDGVHLVKEATLKNLWKLKPFKTFPEVEQPDVNYILRVDGKQDAPRFALFEADGGMWKIRATKAVREWLVNAVKPALAGDADKVIIL
jgi:hypothetical protein